MVDINKLRESIDEVDKKLVELFEKRMDIVEKIIEYKKINSIPIEDKEREKQVLNKNLKYIENDDYRQYIIGFLENIMELSKDFQRKK